MNKTLNAGAAATKCAETKTLQDKIEWLDAISQESSDQIQAIAHLTAAALGGPDGAEHVANARIALLAIAHLAASSENAVNSEAEALGCNHKDG